MLKKIELVRENKLDEKTLNKIKGGGWCCCASCICGIGQDDTWSSDNSDVSEAEARP